MKIILIFTLIEIYLITITKCNIIIKPSKQSTNQAGFIMVQGAYIPAINYKIFAQELQNRFNGSLWVVLTEFPSNLPEPVLVNNIMTSAFNSLKSSGFNFDSKTPFFFAGHSLGGIVVQNYILNNSNKLPFLVNGLILEGSFITRSNLEKTLSSQFKVPILTIGAELDGLARISRLAESFYHNYYDQKYVNSHTVILSGMNHYQFSGEGQPPSTVVKNDIKPEIDNESARAQLTSLINAFINIVTNRANPQDQKLFSDSIQSTLELAQPIIDGFKLEGFYHFNPPCSSEKIPNCTIGSPWTVTAQTIMSSLSPSLINVADAIGPVVSIPEHFPSMSNCTPPATCALNISTITQNVYSLLDTIDNGLDPVASVESRTKMQSRQSILEKYTNKKFDFNQTDTGNICADINTESLNWALKSAPLHTVKRYLDKGKMLVMGNDVGPISTGFGWVTTALKFTQKVDSKNRTYVEVGSPTLRTPTDYSVSFVAGYHYCKLLSPARAIEWIYVDSVKP